MDGDEPAVARRAVLRPDLRRMAVDVARERLLAVVDHLHGPARVQSEQRGVDLDREVLAAAERAADAGEVDAHLLGGEREARRNLVAIDVDPLGGDVDVDASLPVRDGEAGLGAEERLVLGAHLVDAADRDVALGVRIAVPDHHRADDVGARVLAEAVAGGRAVGMQRLLLRRLLGVGDRRQLLVGDLDRGGGAACFLRAVGGDDRHRLSVVADTVDREHRLVGDLEAVRLRSGHVGVRQDGVDARAARAAETSIARMRACACGLRSVWPQSMPGASRSLENANSPFVFGTASERRMLSPTRPCSSRLGAATACSRVGALSSPTGTDFPVTLKSGGGPGWPRSGDVAHVLSAAVFTASTIFW